MNTFSLHRHDLVWLDPTIDAGLFAAAGQRDLARDWVHRAFPLVVARQSGNLMQEAGQIMLGFTLPSAPMRTRVLLRADRKAIIRHSRPLPLSEALQHAPAAWRAGLDSLHTLLERTGTEARVYGSLSSEIFTGMRYLDEASDLDLLLECGATTKLRELLAGLEDFSPEVLRIDGEVLSASGWAVAWRELASAVRAGTQRQVLAKSDREACLIAVDEFTQPILLPA
ncbi:malonate decarboxylase holo-[acyl-carrier-protein] synthase [Sideroxydans sp. CL21]|uniref:malonate decarboxylase holo-[acyl-carrier-protein] synthase n=1 Tax=Sideroxydans sp. CL21 TaxID=2600596 RepID=UPI0012AA1AE1|nr:malonate decarboxylase holo-[acyl-carrier-protein] synthase [Sideroxydans sp. CL21]VVC84251.1 Phosphoribosyl-dephospho-CoA transferase (EC 2.7.7.-) [Sideroxydans sp. CL21]